ncbi:MAG TPA: GAF domain-containing sensor histidine kinase [Trebonia sp.]|jgi:signal transduction histidine kinase|nr:GAF domain-containing sensor histidine kinase [Trebonia sp.]
MAECLDELSLVSQAVLAVSRQMPVRQVLQVIVDSARTLADATYAALGVPDERGSFGEFVVSGLTAAQQRAIGPLPRQHGMLAELLRGAQPERLPDITADPRYGGWLPQAHPPMGPFIGVPVRHGDEVLGIILAANKTTGGEFTPHDQELLTLFAAHAAIALTNARLHEDSRELSAVAERARLARELHDAVSQKLFSIRAHARAASVLAERDAARAAVAMSAVSELAAEAQAELRAVIEGLAPPALDGLVASLRRYADLAARAHGVRVSVTERSVPPLDPATEVAVYRVAQEALHNALRHSGGRCVTVSVSGASRRIVLEVTDDGSGFDPLSAPGSGLGLASMRQRAATAGGTVQVVSAPGQGTTVRLEAPVRTP